MEVILLEKIVKLGDLGDTVSVKPGYARNYLLPQKKAVRATAAAQEEVDRRKAKLLLEEKERLDVAEARAEAAIRSLKFTRSVIDAEGRLFGSVTTTDIVEAAAQQDCELLRSEIALADGTIKNIGNFIATVRVHPQVEFELQIEVEAENPEVLEAAPSEEPEAAASDEDSQDSGDGDSEAAQTQENQE